MRNEAEHRFGTLLLCEPLANHKRETREPHNINLISKSLSNSTIIMSSASTSITSTSCLKPKRPLTPYNLFYRFKRSKIIQASSTKSISKSAILRLVQAVPGLEDMSRSELKLLHPKDVYATSRDIVRREMQDNLLPFDGKRSHRRSHGAIEFLEMGRMMCDQWKLVDEPIKEIFKELAEDGKKLHKERYKKDTAIAASSRSSSRQAEYDVSIKISESEDTALSTTASNTNTDVSSTSTMPLISIPTEVDSVHSSSSHCIPCSPRPTKVGKVNIITPVASPKVKVTLDDYVQGMLVEASSEEDEVKDEFCQFIDSHIHLVDDIENNLLEFDDYVSHTLNELIDMDETIDHCTLAMV